MHTLGAADLFYNFNFNSLKTLDFAHRVILITLSKYLKHKVSFSGHKFNNHPICVFYNCMLGSLSVRINQSFLKIILQMF